MRIATYALPSLGFPPGVSYQECSMSLPPKDDTSRTAQNSPPSLHRHFPFLGAFQGFEVWVSGASAGRF